MYAENFWEALNYRMQQQFVVMKVTTIPRQMLLFTLCLNKKSFKTQLSKLKLTDVLTKLNAFRLSHS